jgi:hypothetical protein
VAIRIKNWAKFQHFSDRRPPWIKLYRDILDDIEWHDLEPASAKVLVMLWLIASESDGALPAMRELSFRLRIPEKQVESIVSKLSHWLERDDINAISGRHQADDKAIPLARSQETEGETEKEERQKVASRAKAHSAFGAVNGHAVFQIPCIGGEFGLSAEQLAEFEKLYPAVDVRQTLNEIRGWNLAHPSRQKTPRGVLGHVNSWMAKEQNRG